MPNNLNDAILEAVKAIGGVKKVGCLLFPEKDPESAQRFLSDCLNPERPARLSPDHFRLVMKLAHEIGHHGIMEFLCGDVGYTEAKPVSKKDETQELMKKIFEMHKQQSEMIANLCLIVGNKL